MPVVLDSTALVELTDMLDYLGLTSSDSDNKILSLINEVSADCQDRFCRRAFLTASYTEYQDGDNTNLIILNNWPVIGSITSLIIEEDGDALDADQFVLYPDEGVIKLKYKVTPRSFREVEIQYTAGYANRAALPRSLVFSIKKGVAHKYKVQQRKADGVLSQALQNQSAQYISDEYPKEVLAIWDHYRRKRAI